jgi:hypothetical protein
MPLVKCKSDKAFSENVSRAVKAGSPQKQALAIAYSVKKKAHGKAGGGPICKACGGKMAHGGEVSNEKLHPEHEATMPSDMARDERLEYAPGNVQTHIGQYAEGGITELDATDAKEIDDSEMDHYAQGGATNMDFAKPMHPMSEYDMYAEGGETEKEVKTVGSPQSRDAAYAQGGMTEKDVKQDYLDEGGSEDHAGVNLVDEIMHDRARRHMAEGGQVTPTSRPGHQEPDEVDDFERRVDLEPVHIEDDPRHDQSNPSEDDEGLVGQILKERKMRRRG